MGWLPAVGFFSLGASSRSTDQPGPGRNLFSVTEAIEHPDAPTPPHPTPWLAPPVPSKVKEATLLGSTRSSPWQPGTAFSLLNPPRPEGAFQAPGTFLRNMLKKAWHDLGQKSRQSREAKSRACLLPQPAEAKAQPSTSLVPVFSQRRATKQQRTISASPIKARRTQETQERVKSITDMAKTSHGLRWKT